MQCSRCHRDEIFFQPYSGLHLCSQHLIADVEAKAKKMIRAQGWLKTGDQIAVLLSGNQNSSALLYFLKKLTAERCDIRISAITVADCIELHSNTSHAKRIAERLDADLIEVSLPEEFRIGTDISTGKKQDISSPQMLPASRSIIDMIAQQHGITKIAWGLCLDEAAGVVLECVISGDGEKLVRSSSVHDGPLRICPFIAVTSAEVSLYADLCGCGDEPIPRPEPGDGLHKDTIAMLNGYTNNHPATKYALLNLGENLSGSHGGIAGLIHACELYRKYHRGCGNDGSIQIEVKNGAT